jgi:hypothetical protein
LLPRDTLQKAVRQCGQHARPVTCVGFAPTGSAVIHIPQDCCSVLDDLMTALTLDVSHKSDTAVLVFKLRIVQPVSLGSSEGRAIRGRVLIAADIFHGSLL